MSTSPAEPFRLEARQIRKSFGGVEVLHGVDLDAAGGSVLALLGENGAGKSTLVKIIAGDYQADGGTLDYDGVVHGVVTPRQARDLGVAIIFQEFQDASTLTVAENISLGRLPNRRGIVDWRAMNRRAERSWRTSRSISIRMPRSAPCASVSGRSSRSLGRCQAPQRLLILDEPTAALSHHEAEILFGFIRRLKEQSVAIIYITHRLDEVTEIADRVQVLRDGDTSLVADVAVTDRAAMIEAMIGRRMSEVQRRRASKLGLGLQPALAWRNASSGRAFQDVSVEVLPGAGGGAVRQARFRCRRGGRDGVWHPRAGQRYVSRSMARASQLSTADGRHRAGAVGFLPADRKAGGAFMIRPVAENVVGRQLAEHGALGWLQSTPGGCGVPALA